MKYAELKRFLKSKGCYKVKRKNKRGEYDEHEKWYSPISGEYFRVSRHEQQEVPPGTLHSILKKAGLK